MVMQREPNHSQGPKASRDEGQRSLNRLGRRSLALSLVTSPGQTVRSGRKRASSCSDKMRVRTAAEENNRRKTKEGGEERRRASRRGGRATY